MTGGRFTDDGAEAEFVADAVRLGPLVDIDDLGLVPDDLHHPVARAMWRAVVERIHARRPITPATIRAAVMNDGLPGAAVDDLLARGSEIPTLAGLVELAYHLRAHAARVRAQLMLEEATDALRRGTPVSNVFTSLELEIAGQDLTFGLDDHAESMRDFPDEEDDVIDWLFEGSIAKGDRAMIVGRPGGGKSLLTTQLAVCCAVGFDPFLLCDIEPRPALIVNGENRASYGRRQVRQVLERLRPHVGDERIDNAPLFVRFEEDGIDLRGGVDYARMTRWVRETKPAIIALGPLYGVGAEKRGREEWEEAANDFRRRVNRIVKEYGCAIAMEHHGTKADPYVPANSHVLQRWPDIGLSLVPLLEDRRDVMRLEPFRPPRGERPNLPEALRWGRRDATVSKFAGQPGPARPDALPWMPTAVAHYADDRPQGRRRS